MYRESLAERVRRQAAIEDAQATDLGDTQIELCARILLPVLTRRREGVTPPAQPLSVR